MQIWLLDISFFLSRFVQFFCSYFFNTFICLIFVVSNLLEIFSTPIFFSRGITLSVSTLMFATFSKCTMLCSGYSAHLSDYL